MSNHIRRLFSPRTSVPSTQVERTRRGPVKPGLVKLTPLTPSSAKPSRYPIAIGAILVLICGAIASAQQVQRTPALPATSYEYATIDLPAHFNNNAIASADNTPGDNPVTNAGATLGRVLFYDRLLSANNTVSCSSCHLQSSGFSDPVALSRGFDGGLTGRNSMGLANARYYENGHFFWDERAETLEEQVLLPIQDSIEMGLTLAELESKLSAADYYPELFSDAFGTPEITSERVSLALAQFVRSMVSYQSKYDQGVAQNFSNFTAQENQGRQIFEGRAGGCEACHDTAIQIADRVFNNGLDATTTDAGAGNGRFKVPSLRNIALTGPYMHDGRFATLAEVVEHYNSGVQPHPNLANQLRVRGNGGDNGGDVQPRRLNLDANQQAALVAFMNTLTDAAFTTDVRFSDPFIDEPVPTATLVVTSVATPVPTPTATATSQPEQPATPIVEATTVNPTVGPTVPPTVVTPPAVVSPTPPPATDEQETISVRPGRRRQVRFGETRNGPRLTLDVAANALSTETTLTFTPLSTPNNVPANARFAGSRFILSALQGATAANVLVFNAPVEFQVRYQDEDGLDDAAIRLLMLEPATGDWASATCGNEGVDAGENYVTADVCQLGEFALFEVTEALDAPTAELPPVVTPGSPVLNETTYLPLMAGR